MSFTQKKKRKEKTSELDANGKTFLVVENNAALYLFFIVYSVIAVMQVVLKFKYHLHLVGLHQNHPKRYLW